MSWRGLGVVLALAALGVAAGLMLAVDQRAAAPPVGPAEPVPAKSPAVPLDPPPSVAPDPDRPPLRTGLSTHLEVVGGLDFGVAVPVPDGWEKHSLASAENRWTLPGNPPASYSLRVEMVFGERLTIEEMMSQRSEALDEANDFTVVSQDDDTLVFTFIDESNHRRLQMLRWISPRATGTAEVEIAVVGRLRDEVGMAWLLETVSAQARVP